VTERGSLRGRLQLHPDPSEPEDLEQRRHLHAPLVDQLEALAAGDVPQVGRKPGAAANPAAIWRPSPQGRGYRPNQPPKKDGGLQRWRCS
jgi:hypothetical protein